jgi:DNA helicase-2/ATP-dependent DNA helicase PcrA
LRTLGRLRALAARAEVPAGEWLDAVAIGDEPVTAEEEATHLSSVHLDKGREFLATFVLGVEEGLLPHVHAILPNGETDGDALDEELRVLYVALTRPRERLCVSACRSRTRDGQTERRQPSRWLHALPPELLTLAA